MYTKKDFQELLLKYPSRAAIVEADKAVDDLLEQNPEATVLECCAVWNDTYLRLAKAKFKFVRGHRGI